MTTTDPCDPWDRQAGESRQAFEAFRVYLTAGPTRRLPGVAHECTKSLSLVKRWSSRWRWASRTDAWDTWLHHQHDAEMRERSRTVGRRHADIASTFLEHVTTALGEVDVADLTPSDLARWFDVATKVERLSVGLPDRALALSSPDGGPVALLVAEMTDEQRDDRMHALVRELERRFAERELIS